jgi:hypothetical protein
MKKKLKTKWKKGDGSEIDAYVNVTNITIRKNRYPVGRSGGGGGSSGAMHPPEYGSIVEYYISDDKDGENSISRGQVVDNFDMSVEGIDSVEEFTKKTLKKSKHLKDMVEVDEE